ncbi:thiamine pyrophosphate-binding protein [Bradyrhizobium sp. 150]|uniref:thiamine pyrophosphate-binding protein n=1 Tax=Bradyrhizobium sp. 150 TaxID=2782625 RepID=UPI001FFC1FFC|nr:thiamine pyrophosphate-binding protein [Bradyrhizobium sp. 150]
MTAPPKQLAHIAQPKTMTGGRFIAETLKAQGVSHVFFMDAILRHALTEMEDLGIKRVLGHSEKAVAYMADGYARASRGPGVCMAQSVGAANLAAALQESWFAFSPVIALTGRHPAQNQYRNAYQELPHEPLYASVTKFSGRVDVPDQLPHVLRQAFRMATAGPSRPVHIDLVGHTGQIAGSTEILASIVPEEEYSRIPSSRPSPDGAQVAKAAVALQKSRRPVVVAGAGAILSGAELELTAFAEKHLIPIVMSLDAKQVLLDGHPLNGGVVGAYSQTCANQIVHAADLVFFVGSDTGDMTTNNWTLPRSGTVVVQVDIDATELGRNFPGTIGMHADPLAALRALDAVMAPCERDRTEWSALIASLVSNWRTDVEAECASNAVPMRPERLCRELGRWLPSDAILVADTGFASHWSGTLLPLTDRRQLYLRAAGSLGWAFPASLGAQCAHPDRPVICLTGDGGFMYHLPELETARRHRLNTITIVNNNHRLAQGRRNIEAAYEGRGGNKDEIFVYREMDFAKLARDMDCFGVRVEHPADLPKAFEEARASGLPAVIDVPTDPSALAPLPWSGEG